MADRAGLISAMAATLDGITDTYQESAGAYIAGRLNYRFDHPAAGPDPGGLEQQYPNHLTNPIQSGQYLSGAQISLGAAVAEVFENNTWRPQFLGAIADAILLQTALDPHAAVRATTTANITLSGPQTIDGVSIIAGDRVLVKNQTTGSQNGIYVAAAGAWSRALDMDTNGEMVHGSFAAVLEGTVNEGTSWIVTTDNPILIGTTAVTWDLYQGSQTISAGDGMVRIGNVFNVGAGTGIVVGAHSVGIDPAYTGQASIVTVGTITSGVWTGTPIAGNFGGTGQSAVAIGDILYGSASNVWSRLAGPSSAAERKFLSSIGTGISAQAPVWTTISSADLPGGFSGFSNPSVTVGLTAKNGTAPTAMRSDGAPALDVSISPTWTGSHAFSNLITANGKIDINLANASINGVRIISTTTTNSAAMTFTNIGRSFVGRDNSSGSNIGNGDPYALCVWNEDDRAVVFGTNNNWRMKVDSSNVTINNNVTSLAVNTNLTVSGNTTLTGSIGMGTGAPASSIFANMIWGGSNSGATNEAFHIDMTSGSFTAMDARGVVVKVGTPAVTFTASTVSGVYVKSTTKGTNSTITNTYGIYVESQTVGTFNYAIKTNAGLVWIGDGTAIGTASPTGYTGLAIALPSSGTGGGTTYGLTVAALGHPTDLTSVIGIYASASCGTNAAVVYSASIGVSCPAPSGSGSITTAVGIDVGNIVYGTNKYAIRTGTGLVQFGGDLYVTRSSTGFVVSRIYNSSNTASAVGLLEITAGGTSSAYAGIQFDVAGNANSFLMAILPSVAAVGLQTGFNGIAWYAHQGATAGYANLSLCGYCSSFNGGDNIIFVANVFHYPSANPTGGGYLYSDSGALKWRGSSGTITTIAPA